MIEFLKFGLQEIDLACAPYIGTNGRDVMELAVYITGDGFSILEKYPAPPSIFSKSE